MTARSPRISPALRIRRSLAYLLVATTPAHPIMSVGHFSQADLGHFWQASKGVADAVTVRGSALRSRAKRRCQRYSRSSSSPSCSANALTDNPDAASASNAARASGTRQRRRREYGAWACGLGMGSSAPIPGIPREPPSTRRPWRGYDIVAPARALACEKLGDCVAALLPLIDHAASLFLVPSAAVLTVSSASLHSTSVSRRQGLAGSAVVFNRVRSTGRSRTSRRVVDVDRGFTRPRWSRSLGVAAHLGAWVGGSASSWREGEGRSSVVRSTAR